MNVWCFVVLFPFKLQEPGLQEGSRAALAELLCTGPSAVPLALVAAHCGVA